MKIKITYVSDYLKMKNIKKGDIFEVFSTGTNQARGRYYYVPSIKTVIYEEECEMIHTILDDFLISMN